MDFKWINTRNFINEVQCRPAIWDPSCEDYNNKDKRKDAWENLTRLFTPENADITTQEMQQFTRNLQRRWKNVRDCYTRELLRLKKLKAGSAVPRRSVYIYFNQLGFLRSIVKPSKRSGKINGDFYELEDPISVKENFTERTTVVPTSTTTRLKETPSTSFNYAEQYLADPLDSHQPDSVVEEDCDKLFLLSLVKHLKDVPEENRIEVKMEIMQVIQRAQQRGRQLLQNPGLTIKHESGMTTPIIFDENSLDSIKEPPTPDLLEYESME